MLFLAAFIFGAIVGSFLNVCIYRLPLGQSVAWPSSHCQCCKKPIAWHDNIPCVSYFILKGKCRNCGAGYSSQYIWIEFLTGLLFVLFLKVFGLTIEGGIYLAFTLALLVVTMIDFRHYIIPDEISYPGIMLGLISSTVWPFLQGQETWQGGLFQSFIGILAGGGSLYAAGTIAEWILKKEAMGGGDVKLLAMIGALLGWPAVLWTVFVSSFIGSAAGLYLRWKKGAEQIPYGPYLALAAFLYLFFGKSVIEWYLASLGLGN